MAEVLVEFEDWIEGENGKRYEARACGRERPDGMWEGWLEFEPADGSETLRTGRETTQPNRDDLAYWATGLTIGYLDGALMRVLRPTPVLRARPATKQPKYPAPAPAHAILDPYKVYAEGDQILRNQLAALDEMQLRNIIRAYGFPPTDDNELITTGKPELIASIMLAVSKRAA